MCASHWACTKPRGTMKVKAVRTVGSGRIRGLETACGALPARLDRSVGEAALEPTGDLKGDLSLGMIPPSSGQPYSC